MPPIHRKSDNCLGFLGGAERRCDPAGLQSAAPSWLGVATARKGQPSPPGISRSPWTSAQEPRGGNLRRSRGQDPCTHWLQDGAAMQAGAPRAPETLPDRPVCRGVAWPDVLRQACAPGERCRGSALSRWGAMETEVSGRRSDRRGTKDKGMKEPQARVTSPDTGLTTRPPRRPHWGLWFGAGAAR